MIRFTSESMFEIIQIVKKNLEKEKTCQFEVLNPDLFKSKYAGEIVIIDKKEYLYRGYKAWQDLAQKLFSRMLTPIKVSEVYVRLEFEKLDLTDSFHNKNSEKEEKYGVGSTFFEINKNEEPEVLLSYFEALQNVKIEKRKRILNLGVNTGEEFEIIESIYDKFPEHEFVGIDYCESAIAFAKDKFKEKTNVKFYAQDINCLDELALGKFDLIISIGTLQSSNLDFNKTFMDIVQNYLNNDGSMILGFPNCRWIDGEIIYGAKAPNYSFSEMSILYKDAFFCKKYLQQKKFRVTLTGKYYIFLTATSIRK
ncbi:class I SAM-dependent methyltransferase [Arcobacter sp. LA11]|uniref:class I SAM-dependent methyltransferase n=1 Tax=Arcobacter sp. LA11 TaxID=1898176 RepID=UPI00093264E3|nr:class I SAM-dependent methyltransferase [Arcobacter sp. LA11]